MNVGFTAGAGGSVFDTLVFVLVKHSLNGTYLGTEARRGSDAERGKE